MEKQFLKMISHKLVPVLYEVGKLLCMGFVISKKNRVNLPLKLLYKTIGKLGFRKVELAPLEVTNNYISKPINCM